MTATINTNASGAWTVREGEMVEVAERAPNGMATGVVTAGSTRVVWIPTRWLDFGRAELRRRPLRRCRGIAA